jgi:NADPH:quinone reductase-like Zn-dependent oxidoreductase
LTEGTAIAPRIVLLAPERAGEAGAILARSHADFRHLFPERARRPRALPNAGESVGVTRATDAMSAIRVHPPGTVEALALERIGIPRVGAGEALVRVHAAAITRDELEWPADRLPAIPSYELSGTIAARASAVSDVAVGDPVWALTGFDRDGAAAEYTLVPVAFLAPKPRTLGHVESAAIPLAGLTAWQGLFAHGALREGERVLIHGAAGGVGQFATQLARWRGAYVIGTSAGASVGHVLALGANEAVDRTAALSDEAVAAVDLVFDTVGGEALARSPGLLREGGRVVSVAEEPPAAVSDVVQASYFVVEPRRAQLIELARLVDEGRVRPLVDSVFPLAEARAAFERVAMPGKRGKVVLQVAADEAAGR